MIVWVSAACVLAFLGLSSCAWRVIPPDRVGDPVPVFLSEYGRHTRLALPDGTAAFFDTALESGTSMGSRRKESFPRYVLSRG